MGKIIRIVVGCLLAFFWVACNTNEISSHETTFTEFSFLSGNVERDLTLQHEEPIRLEWEESHAENSTVVFYRVQFSNKKDGFSNPSYELVPNRLGMDTYIELNDSILNVVSELAGVRQAESGTFYCSVLASNGVSSRAISGDPLEIKVKRPDGFAAIPEKLYIQKGSEFVKLKNSAFRGEQPVGFDVVVELKSGERIAIVDSKTGYQRHFSLDTEQHLKELYDGNFEMECPADGVYHVGVNFLTKEAIFAKIDQVDLVVVRNGMDDNVVATLDYAGNYTWSKMYTALLSDGSPLPNGASYKFRFFETSTVGNVPVVAYWGSNTKTVLPPTAETESDYFYVCRVTAGGADYFFRFPISMSGKSMKVVLSMDPVQEHFSHTNQVTTSM